MRNLLTIGALILTSVVGIAQTATDLQRSVNQLPPQNAARVLALGSSTRLHRGLNATTGFDEVFAPDPRCSAGGSNAMGWDKTSNLNCAFPGYYVGTAAAPASMDLERTLAYGVTNNQPPAPNHLAFTFSDIFGNTNNTATGYAGVSTCAVGSTNCGAANEIGIFVNAAGLYLQNAGVNTLLWAGPGNTQAAALIRGQTDSTYYTGTDAAWAPASVGALYGFTFMLVGDGTAIISAVPMNGALCVTSCSFSARIPVTLPAGSIHQFFVRGTSADFISDVSLADGYTLPNGITRVFDLAAQTRTHVGKMLRWAINPDGTEYNYASGACSNCHELFAVIPPNYNPDTPNPWMMQFRGQEFAVLSFFGDYANLAPALYDSGYVQAWGDWNDVGYYGAPQNFPVVAGAINLLKSALALETRPHVTADSAGGIMVANMISHGVFLPLDWICYSCNLNLLADWTGNNQANQAQGVTQAAYVEADYGFTDPTQYAVVTAGYDPLLIVQNPRVNQGKLNATATYPLLDHAADVYAAIPTYLVSDQDPGDSIVNQSINSTAWCSAVNAVPGAKANCQNVYIGGGHVSSNKFQPIPVITFLNSHP